MADRQIRFDIGNNYPNAMGNRFTMLSLVGRPSRLSSIFQLPENRTICYVVSMQYFKSFLLSLSNQFSDTTMVQLIRDDKVIRGEEGFPFGLCD